MYTHHVGESSLEQNSLSVQSMPESLELGADEVVQVDLNQSFLLANSSGLPHSRSYDYPGTIVDMGKEVMHLDLVDDPAELSVSIVDIRGAHIQDTDINGEPLRSLGWLHNEKVIRRGDYVVALHSEDWQQVEIHSLLPGADPLIIGRGHDATGKPHVGSLTAGLLPRTVSREHCAVSLGQNGELTVESLNPKNPIVLGRPPVDLALYGRERLAADRLAAALRRTPEAADQQVLMHNLSMMYGASSAMSRLLQNESIGGNAGQYNKDGQSYPCAGANGFYDSKTGAIKVFENPRSVPERLVRTSNDFCLRVVVDMHDGGDFAAGITNVFRNDRVETKVPKIEQARDMMDLSVAVYNELKAH